MTINTYASPDSPSQFVTTGSGVSVDSVTGNTGLVPPGTYNLTLRSEHGAAVTNDSAIVTVDPRATTDITAYTAPETASEGFENASAIRDAIADGTLTASATAAANDTVVYAVNATGLTGLVNAANASLERGADLGRFDGLSFGVGPTGADETDAPDENGSLGPIPNGSAVHLDRGGLFVVADGETAFGTATPPTAGETFEAGFRVDDDRLRRAADGGHRVTTRLTYEVAGPTNESPDGGNETDSEAVSSNETDSEVTVSNETESGVTSSNETESGVTSSNETDQEVTASNETNQEATVSNETEPEVTPSNGTDSEAVSSNETDPEVTASNETESDVTSSNQTELGETPSNETGSEVTSSNETSSGAMPSNETGPRDTSESAQTGESAGSDAARGAAASSTSDPSGGSVSSGGSSGSDGSTGSADPGPPAETDGPTVTDDPPGTNESVSVAGSPSDNEPVGTDESVSGNSSADPGRSVGTADESNRSGQGPGPRGSDDDRATPRPGFGIPADPSAPGAPQSARPPESFGTEPTGEDAERSSGAESTSADVGSGGDEVAGSAASTEASDSSANETAASDRGYDDAPIRSTAYDLPGFGPLGSLAALTCALLLARGRAPDP